MTSARPIPRAATQARRVAIRVRFVCPRCDVELEGFDCDPSGRYDIDCESCGETFDIPAASALVIVRGR